MTNNVLNKVIFSFLFKVLTERKCGDIVKRKLWFSSTVVSKTVGREQNLLLNRIFISPVS